MRPVMFAGTFPHPGGEEEVEVEEQARAEQREEQVKRMDRGPGNLSLVQAWPAHQPRSSCTHRAFAHCAAFLTRYVDRHFGTPQTHAGRHAHVCALITWIRVVQRARVRTDHVDWRCARVPTLTCWLALQVVDRVPAEHRD
jgi:hypothetical protein